MAGGGSDEVIEDLENDGDAMSRMPDAALIARRQGA